MSLNPYEPEFRSRGMTTAAGIAVRATVTGGSASVPSTASVPALVITNGEVLSDDDVDAELPVLDIGAPAFAPALVVTNGEVLSDDDVDAELPVLDIGAPSAFVGGTSIMPPGAYFSAGTSITPPGAQASGAPSAAQASRHPAPSPAPAPASRHQASGAPASYVGGTSMTPPGAFPSGATHGSWAVNDSGRAMAAMASSSRPRVHLADITKRLISSLQQRGGLGEPFTLPPGEDFMSQSADYFGHRMPIVAPVPLRHRQGDPKTELCIHWAANGRCPLGAQCRFAHGEAELLLIDRPENFRTRLCRYGYACPYGRRCHFRH